MPKLIPNYLTVDPATGDVGAVFPGGVQILAGELSTPPDERKVRWVRQSDGYQIADLGAGGADPVSFGSTLTEQVHRVPDYIPGIDQTVFNLIARDENAAGKFAQFSAVIDDVAAAWPKGTAHLRAMAAPNPPPAFNDNPAKRVLVDQNGASNLVSYSDLSERTDVRIVGVGTMAIGALAAGATALSVVIPTTLDSRDNRPAGSAVPGPLTPSFQRFFGGFSNFVGNQLAWGYNITVVANMYNVQIQVRNVTAAASAATTFAGILVVSYT